MTLHVTSEESDALPSSQETHVESYNSPPQTLHASFKSLSVLFKTRQIGRATIQNSYLKIVPRYHTWQGNTAMVPLLIYWLRILRFPTLLLRGEESSYCRPLHINKLINPFTILTITNLSTAPAFWSTTNNVLKTSLLRRLILQHISDHRKTNRDGQW